MSELVNIEICGNFSFFSSQSRHILWESKSQQIIAVQSANISIYLQTASNGAMACAETLEDHICIPLFYKNTQSILVEGLIQLSIYSPHNSDFSKEIKGRFCLSLHYYLPYPIPDEN